MEWVETRFFPVPFCNTFSLHRIQGARGSGVMCVTLFGRVVWMDEKTGTDLRELLAERLDEGLTVELVASDCADHPDRDIVAFLATCWVVYDTHYMPIRYYAALFKISPDLSMSLGCKFPLENPPTFTRVTAGTRVAQYRHCWLIFTASRAVRLFTVEVSVPKKDEDSLEVFHSLNRLYDGDAGCFLKTVLDVEEIDSIGDVYPGLDLGDLPGSAVRSCCLQTSKYRWSVLGFDTGYVIVTSLSLATNYIVDRSKLKFSGVISVLQLLRLEEREDKILVVISSTLGPAAVWSLAMTADKSHFEWTRTSVLEETRGHDAIVCSALGRDLLAIGTYGGHLAIYRRDDVMSGERVVYPCACVAHSSPIIAVAFQSDESLVLLSTSGLHAFQADHTPTSSVFADEDSRSVNALTIF